MAKQISNLVQQVFKEEHAWKIKLLQEWHSIFGNLSKYVQVEKIEKDTLILGVTNSCWLQEFYLLSPLLLKTINEKLANSPIKQLRFKLSGIKHHPKKITSVAPRAPMVSRTLSPSERTALAQIKDPELATALEQFLVRCYQD